MSTGESNKENAPPANPEPGHEPDKESQAPEVAPAPKVSKGKGKKKNGAPSQSTKACWKPPDDKILVDTLLKEREEGHQTDSGFKPTSYPACAEALKASQSGGAVKTAGSCADRWTRVCAGMDCLHPVAYHLFAA